MSFSDTQILVSVLLAARDEEANIERCLLSLAALDYPVEQIEICIGDDDSTDNTALIVQNFIESHPQFTYLKISTPLKGLKGKANVLAQLARQAKGKYFLFCDADIAVQPGWVTAMLRQFKSDTGIVVGLTRMKESHLLADFLSLEWLFALTIMKVCSLFKIPITGLGNNMAITREAYVAAGGYEKLGFSIVEDYALFTAIVAKGYGFVQAYRPKVVSLSEPINTFGELRIQRRRWIEGVMQSFWLTRLCIVLSAFVVPFLIILAIWFPGLSAQLLAGHYLVITGTTIVAITWLRQPDLWKTVFFFWFYLFGHTTVMLINYFRPGRLVWKGREY